MGFFLLLASHCFKKKGLFRATSVSETLEADRDLSILCLVIHVTSSEIMLQTILTMYVYHALFIYEAIYSIYATTMLRQSYTSKAMHSSGNYRICFNSIYRSGYISKNMHY